MPEYDFFCKCGERGNRIVSVDDRDTQVCTCGKIMKRKISLPGKAVFRTIYKDAPRYESTIHEQFNGYDNGRRIALKG